MVAYADRLYIPPDSPLLLEVVAATHDDGHEGVQRTLHRLRRDFFFPAMRRVVQDFVRACDPLAVEIEGDFNVRGNIKTTVRAEYKKK